MYHFALEGSVGEKFSPITVRSNDESERRDESIDYRVGSRRLRVEDGLLFLDGTFRVKVN